MSDWSELVGREAPRRIISIPVHGSGHQPVHALNVTVAPGGRDAPFRAFLPSAVAVTPGGTINVEVQFRPPRKGRFQSTISVRGPDGEILGESTAEGEGLSPRRGHIYTLRTQRAHEGLPLDLPVDRWRQDDGLDSVVFGVHPQLVVSADDANRTRSRASLLIMRSLDDKDPWGYLPVGDGEANLRKGFVDCFQIITTDMTFPDPVFDWHGAVAPGTMTQVNRVLGGYLSGGSTTGPEARPPLDRAANRQEIHGRVACAYLDSVLLVRGRSGGQPQTRPYLVISHTDINLRWQRPVVTVLRCVPASGGLAPVVSDTPHVVQTADSELGVAGEWLVLCHEPIAMDLEWRYPNKGFVPSPIRGVPFVKEVVKARLDPSTKMAIQKAIQVYLGLS